MSPKSAALQSQDGTSLPGSTPPGGNVAGHVTPPPQRRAHLSLIRSVGVDETVGAGASRRRRWIASAVSVVVVVGVIIGLVVLPGDTQAPAPADRDPQPTQPAGDARRQPAAPVTTAPATEPEDEPHAEDEPRTPAATPTSQGAQPTSSGTEDTTEPGGAGPGPGPASTAPVAPPGTQAPANPTPPPTSPPATTPPATAPPPVTANGVVNGCNTYGENCGDNPLYAAVPPEGYDYASFPKTTTVANGTTLTARCWTRGGVTYNYAAWFNPPDYGPNPYESDVVFNVRVPGGDQWAWLPDTWFVRDKNGRMGLPEC